jgi:FHA domain
MSTGPVPPQLVVVDGRMRGASFDVPPERSEIGRQAGVAILLDDQDVSRRHAVLERAGGRVVLTDPGSTNGTWVNRRRLRAGDPGDRVELRDGDEVRLGSVTLRFSTAPTGDGTAAREYAFGDVHGPVQTGSGQQYTAGRDQYVAGRDQVVAHGQVGEVLAELSSLRETLAGLRLTEAERSSAERDLQGLEEAVAGPEPDTKAASQHLQSFTANLKEAGALATAGVALVEGIAKIAQWLGPLGAGVLALL